MPVVRINLSVKTIQLLDRLKQEWKLDSRGKTLEKIIEELLDDSNNSNSTQEQ